MRRAILTLMAAGLCIPLVAATASAGPRSDRSGLSVVAGPGGIQIDYHRDRRDGGRRGDVSRREVDVRLRLPGAVPHYERTRWVPGQWVIQERQVRLPDRIERVWIPDRYEIRIDACGRPYRVLVEEGHFEDHRIPGEVIVQREQVWVPGHWERC
jgi:hypothetical protein